MVSYIRISIYCHHDHLIWLLCWNLILKSFELNFTDPGDISLSENASYAPQVESTDKAVLGEERSGILVAQQPGHYAYKYEARTKLDTVLRPKFSYSRSARREQRLAKATEVVLLFHCKGCQHYLPGQYEFGLWCLMSPLYRCYSQWLVLLKVKRVTVTWGSSKFSLIYNCSTHELTGG